VPDPLVFKGPSFRSISFGDDLADRLTDLLPPKPTKVSRMEGAVSDFAIMANIDKDCH
jgi:hypothetical protein